MGKRTYIKYIKGCQITRVKRRGRDIRTTIKCPGKKKITKTLSAQDILNDV